MNVWNPIRNFLPFTTEPSPAEFPTLPWEGSPWRFPPTERIVAIGDLHGDLSALAALLLEAGLIDDAGHWSGGESHLVLLGDLLGGHPDSRLLLDFVLHLEPEARHAGGAVHPLLGNHDLLPAQGNLSRLTRKERKRYRRPPVPGNPTKGTKNAFRADSIYAKWTRSRNAILQIGETLFLHAGLDRWAEQSDFGAVNATVRAWIAFWQGIQAKPPETTRWAVGKRSMKRGTHWEIGPLWNRTFKVKLTKNGNYRHASREGLSREALEKILAAAGALRLVVGHAPVEGGEILLSHPYFKDRVIMADTRISDKAGTLSALVISAGELHPLTVASRKPGGAIRDRQARQLKEGVETSWWARFRGWVQRG